MKRRKFNSDYCGEIILIGFTGNAKTIQKWLRKNLLVKFPKYYMMKEEKFNVNQKDIVMHIETLPNTNREDLTIK